MFTGCTPGQAYTFFANYAPNNTVYEDSTASYKTETLDKLTRKAIDGYTYKVETGTTGKKITIYPAGLKYKFGDDVSWGEENVKDNIEATDSYTIQIQRPATEIYKEFELSETLNLNKTIPDAPAESEITLSATINGEKTKYDISAEGSGLEFSADGKSYSSTLSSVTAKPSETVQVYARVAADGEATYSAPTVKSITAPAKLAAPTISGKTPFTGSTSVTITAEAGTTIYYTTNGDEPTTSSTQYTGAITISEETTIKAIATKDDRVNSDVATKVFTVGTSNDDSKQTGSGLGSGAGGSGSSDSGSSATTTPSTGTTTEEKKEPSLSTNAGGETIAVDADGKVIVNKVVTIDNSKYITDEDGVVLTGGFYTTANGNLVYASANGKLAVNKLFSVGGKKYVAKKSGALLKSDFYTTPKGNEVYCNKNGVVITNKVFKVGGNKFVAKKSGAIVKKAWVKVGNKKYYCNKQGIVTKTKKVK